MSMVHVIAVITAKPGMRDQVLDLFSANVPAVKEEDGCIEYGAPVDADGGGGLSSAPLVFPRPADELRRLPLRALTLSAQATSPCAPSPPRPPPRSCHLSRSRR